MNTSPKVTIAIPVYNGETYIGKAIESVLNQTFTDFCLTVFDNDSSDGTQQVCEQYKDNRLKYFRNEKNLGMGGNHNRALEHCETPYFKWLSHDDLLAPTYLEKCLELLENDSTLAIAHSKTYNINQDGIIIGNYDHEILLSSFTPSDRFRRLLWMDFVTELHGIMRTDLLKSTVRYGSFPGADRNCLGHMILLGNVAYVSEYLFFYRTHPSNYSLSNKTNLERSQAFKPQAGRLLTSLSANATSLTKWQVYVKSILDSNLSITEQIKCFSYLTEWLLGRIYEEILPNRKKKHSWNLQKKSYTAIQSRCLIIFSANKHDTHSLRIFKVLASR